MEGEGLKSEAEESDISIVLILVSIFEICCLGVFLVLTPLTTASYIKTLCDEQERVKAGHLDESSI